MQSSESAINLPFLRGGGEMGTLIRHYDWTTTPLDSPQHWPQSLRTSVSLILSSKFPMFIWWGDDLIQLYNDAYRPSFGREGKHPTALGQPGAACWPELWTTIKPLIDQVMQTTESTWSENQLIPMYRNGQLEDVYWTFSYAPIFDESDAVGGVLVIVHETTQIVQNALQLQQRTAELATANTELKRSNDNLDLFASAASHDMQEPLRKIQSFGRMLGDKYASTLGEEGSNLLARMESAAERMSHLIRDLLAYARLTTDRKPFKKQDLNQIVDEVLSVLDIVLLEKHAQIEVAPLGIISGDAVQLAQLFQNLLSNSLKFVRRDVIPHIRIYSKSINRSDLPPAYQPPADQDQFCAIQVIDNGIGFDQAQAEHIFGTFQRLNGRHQFSGSGIGLAVVKRMVENHQGYIVAQSQPNQGAAFTIYLPV